MFNLFRHENWLKKLRRIGDREEKFYLLEGRGDGFKGGYKPQKCKDMEIQIFEGILISSGEPFYSTDIHGEDLDRSSSQRLWVANQGSTIPIQALSLSLRVSILKSCGQLHMPLLPCCSLASGKNGHVRLPRGGGWRVLLKEVLLLAWPEIQQDEFPNIHVTYVLTLTQNVRDKLSPVLHQPFPDE